MSEQKPQIPVSAHSKDIVHHVSPRHKKHHTATSRQALDHVHRCEATMSRGVVRGLEELQVLLDNVKQSFLQNCFFCFVVAVSWPFLVVVALFTWPFVLCSNDVYTKNYFAQYSLVALGIVVLFLIFFGIPAAVLSAQEGGLAHFVHLVSTGEIGIAEIGQHWGSFVFFLVLFVYGWVVFDSVGEEVAISLQSRLRYLRTFWKEQLHITDQEKMAVFGELKPMMVEDLLSILGRFPGWRSSADKFAERNWSNFLDDREEKTHKAEEQSEASASLPSGTPRQDIGTPRRHETDDSPARREAPPTEKTVLIENERRKMQGGEMSGFWGKLSKFSRFLFSSHSWGMLCLIFLVSVFRASIPRTWVHFDQGSPWLPGNAVEATFILSSTITASLVFMLWWLLFEAVRTNYLENVNQMLLVTALIDIRKRHVYMRDVLKVDPDDEESFKSHRMKAAGLPFLDLSHVGNLKIWWAVREYAIVDSMDERIALEVVLAVAILYVVMVICYSIVDFLLVEGVSGFTLVCIFDIALVGALVLRTLLNCVNVNDMLCSHQVAFRTARHSIFVPQSKIISLTDAEVLEFYEGNHDRKSARERDALRLLGHLIDRVSKADTLQTIFGLEVTSSNVMQLVVALLSGMLCAFSSVRSEMNIEKVTADIASGAANMFLAVRAH